MPLSNILDKNDDTNAYVTSAGATVTFPTPMKIKKLKTVVRVAPSLTVRVDAIKSNGETVQLYSNAFTVYSTININLDVTGDEYFIGVKVSATAEFGIFTIDVTEAELPLYNQARPCYLNINALGNVLLNGAITGGFKYELVYDGTVFNATEVVYNA